LPIARPGKPSRPAQEPILPAGAAIPDEVTSAQAKDRISDVVKKAAGGGRTVIMSRGYAIADIGPVEDVPPALRAQAMRLPTTEIKSGQTSLKGILARHDFALLTVHGEARAAVYRPKLWGATKPDESKLDRLVALLEETKLVARRNEQAAENAARLERFLALLHEQIEQGLDLLEKVRPDQAQSLRTRYARLQRDLSRTLREKDEVL
jgi:antitoxin (DNA-binding transcriptional repressor) of toxin-antitoxin stability system